MTPTTSRRLRLGVALAATISTAVTGVIVTTANAEVPTIPDPITYDRYQAIQDPGLSAPDYFTPLWYDTQGRHIQAHGGQVVTATELEVDPSQVVEGTDQAGRRIYFWYGEDRSNGYYMSPGVSAYSSYDGFNWTNEGVAMRSVTTRAELTNAYFDEVYDTVDATGAERTALVDDLFYNLNVNPTAPDGSAQLSAIFERPKVLYNAANDQWVMWWHSDGKVVPGGSNYARSMAAVAVSDSPTGPFKLQGAYRLYNRANYQACTTAAVPGQARDMTVFKDTDGTAYIVYSSEENRSLYISKLNADYTNVEKTTATDTVGIQYSADGQYPYLFADGTAGAPVRGTDFQIVRECGMLEAPAVFSFADRYYVVASGATGWAPNQQTYHSADSLLGTWIRGVDPADVHETISYNNIPEGGDGRLAVGDVRKTTFGSQSTDVFEIDAAEGKFVYMGDRWNEGKEDSTYVWLPIVIGENGELLMHNPAVEDPAKWGEGWDESYWDTHGSGPYIWTVTDDRLPESVETGDWSTLPATVAVTANGVTTDVAVTWDTSALGAPGTRTITGTLAGDANFTPGREFSRQVEVDGRGLYNIAPEATPTASSRPELVGTTNDGALKAKGWDDWLGGGVYPKSSWLAYTWTSPRVVESVTVHTYKDGPSATWPSQITVQYQDASGAWVTAAAPATVSQDSSIPAPEVTIDLPDLPATKAIRVQLTTATNVWQSISEVEIFGYSADARAALTSLTVDGKPVAGFTPETLAYTVGATDPASAVVAGTGVEGTTVTVTGPTAGSHLARVTVTASDASGIIAIRTYDVQLVPDGTRICGPVTAPWSAAAWGDATRATFCQAPGGYFEITDNNRGAWTSQDLLSVIRQDEAVTVGGAITTTVTAVDGGGNSDPRAGLVLRNDLSTTGRGSADGYAILTTKPGGVLMQWDADGNGYIDTESAVVTAALPVELKLEYTSATQATGWYRTPGSATWLQVGTAPLRDAATALDAGIFGAGNNGVGTAKLTFDKSAILRAPAPNPTVTVTATSTNTATATATASATVTTTATTTATATATATRTMTATATATATSVSTVTSTATATATATVTAQPSTTATVTVPGAVDHYTTPGFHSVHGRWWLTTCEPYSATVRCWTQIWATTITQVDGRFVQSTGWKFNTLTYLPYMTKEQWGSSHLANTGEYTIDGRRWKTECGTPTTGPKGCRSYIWASNIASERTATGAWRYFWTSGWVLNNIVRLA